MSEEDRQTPQQRLEAEKADIDAMTDTAEQALALAVLRAKVALVKGEKADLLKAQSNLEQYRRQRDSVRFKVVDSRNEPCVLTYLRDLGYQAEKSKVCADVKLGKLLKRDGHYFGKDIEVYARTWCRPNSTASLPDSAADIDKSREQARIAKETADKLAFRNEIERGNYLPKNEVEQMIAASCAFLKQDLANFGPHIVDLFVELAGKHIRAGGDVENISAIVPDLIDEYDSRLERWLGRYAEMQE